MDYKKLLDYAIEEMKKAGGDKAQATLTVSEKHELNTESKTVKLMRSTDEIHLSLKFIKENRSASTTINKATEKDIDEAILKLVDLSKSAPMDEANDISDFAEFQAFKHGVLEPDMDAVYAALETLNHELKTTFEKVSGDAVLSYDRSHKYLMNSNNLYLEEAKGSYNFMMMFAAKDGDKITSFNYTGASILDLRQKLTEVGLLGDLMHQTIKELEAQPFKGKFVGDVIITPNCLDEFLNYINSSALSDGALITGSSKLKDKIGEKIASPNFTWHSNPLCEDLAHGYRVTGDGFIAEDLTIVENGVLKSFLLSQYGANKTGKERSKNYGGAYIVEPGEQSLEDLIGNVEKGILLSRFSGGRPGPDGGFAGVAKNSFYIENGKIQYPLSDTMISGNLFELIENIKGISNKRVNYGSSILPWIHSTGTTISGQ
ncbi:MAG: TldD/PmbA family protein [Clostridia bacterium]|nr:TldD/PmbA family protein [Clostridia bacterium]